MGRMLALDLTVAQADWIFSNLSALASGLVPITDVSPQALTGFLVTCLMLGRPWAQKLKAFLC